METAMRFISTLLLMLLMGTFLGLGFIGLFQHFDTRGHSAAIEQVR